MPLSRSLFAIACTIGLAALLAAPASGAKRGQKATSYLIKTPKGTQLAVPITVNYRLNGKGRSLDDSTLSARVSLAAKLPNGRVLRAAESRRLPGAAKVRIEHHLFFSAARSRILRKALAARQKVELSVISTLRADIGGDGKTDARTVGRSSLTMIRPKKPKAKKRSGRLTGDNPCGVLKLGAPACRNVTARARSAKHLWDANTFRVTCPADYPVASATVRTATTSRRFSQSVLTSGRRARVTVIDDNVSGHDYSYAPTVACTKTARAG